ncbi:hypothetical protein BT96DRAFT_812709 [Gymnopus androsaceus JB14]|uniref:Uncharacterized protein n=1 Tax=Gymnopus androsaceus JB14 TaxID=1447944 RepID=A0A6A4I5G3_9AGAR|nr:hypothetical protein BT96DRAFT_812709 [Gymnopus androsaceus JB14]
MPGPSDETQPCTPTRSRVSLSSTSAAFLISDSPIQSTSQLPKLSTVYISPRKKCYVELLAQEPKTEQERQLQAALRESDKYYNLQKETMTGLQAQSVLHEMYTGRVRGQLEYREEKASLKKSGKLNMDGRAKLLSGDEVYDVVKEHTEWKKAEAAAATKKKAGWESYKNAVDDWKAHERVRKEKNEMILQTYQKAVKKWEAERDNAKYEHRRAHWTKPGKPTTTKGDPPLHKTTPKPKQADYIRGKGKERAEADDDDSEDEEDLDGDGDGDNDGEDNNEL